MKCCKCKVELEARRPVCLGCGHVTAKCPRCGPPTKGTAKLADISNMKSANIGGRR